MDNPKSKPIEEIEWQAPEFEYRPKDISWYWLSLMVGIILLALSVWQKNFMFAIFVVITWFVIIFASRRPPTIWSFKLSEKGIEISLPDGDRSSDKFYPINEVEGFDVHTGSQDYNELILKVRKRFSPYLKIDFPADEKENIEKFLEKYVPKEEYSESLADSFSKLIRF